MAFSFRQLIEHKRDGGVLLVRTGWGSRWEDRTAYLGTSLEGPEAVAELHFPGIGVEAASVHVQAGHFDGTLPGLAHFQ